MTDDLFFGGHRIQPTNDVPQGAIFSADRTRRYVLARNVGAGERIACFVMVNPSKADEQRNDNTVAKCMQFARLWGCGYLAAVNCVPWVSTDPLGLYLLREDEVIADRKHNDRYILICAHAAAKSGGPVVCAWGTHGRYLNQDRYVLGLLAQAGISAQCLGTTAEGYPRHPGRIAYSTPLEPYPTSLHLLQLMRRS